MCAGGADCVVVASVLCFLFCGAFTFFVCGSSVGAGVLLSLCSACRTGVVGTGVLSSVGCCCCWSASAVGAVYGGSMNAGWNPSGGVGFHGVPCTVSSICLSYLASPASRLTVRARTILPATPTKDSPVDVHFPSQIPLKNLGSSFGRCLSVCTMYITVSPYSHSAALCVRPHLAW